MFSESLLQKKNEYSSLSNIHIGTLSYTLRILPRKKYMMQNINKEEEIKARIASGNKVYFANKNMFQSRLISKSAKLRLYYSVIRPIITYSCETWILKETIINKLLVFERQILRKIFGPNNENGIWWIKTNLELDEIIKRKNILNFIQAQRLSWLGHIERMQGTRMVKAIYSHFKKGNRKTTDTLGGWC